MASVTQDGAIALRTLRSGRPYGPVRTYSTLPGAGLVSLSRDGRTMAATGAGIEIVDVRTLRRRAPLAGSENVLTPARFTRDGRLIVAGDSDGMLRVWSADTFRPLGRRLAAQAGDAMTVAVSPDDRTVATGSADGTVQLFDLRTLQRLGAPLPGVPNKLVTPVFTPDGQSLFALSDAGRAWRWDIRPASWARHACAVAGRSLSRSEWSDVLPGRDYAPACR
jgi:WD40 repeat protein